MSPLLSERVRRAFHYARHAWANNDMPTYEAALLALVEVCREPRQHSGALSPVRAEVCELLTGNGYAWLEAEDIARWLDDAGLLIAEKR